MVKKKTEAQIDRYSRFGAPGQWVAALAVGTISASSTFVNLVRSKFHADNEFRQGFSVLHETKNLKLQELNDEQIESSIEILKKYVGNHPAYQKLIEAREVLNSYGRDAIQKSKDGTHEFKSYELEDALTNYTNANEKFLEECRDSIDKAMRSPEYKKLAINSSTTQSNVKMRFDKLYDSFAETIYGIKSKGIIGHTKGVWERFVGFGGYTKRNMLFKTAVAAGVGFGGTIMAFNQLNTRDKLNEIDKQSERVDRKLDALLDKAGVGEHEIETREEHRAHVKEREKLDDRALRKGASHTSKIAASRDSKPSASNDNSTIANDNEHEYRHAASLAAERDGQQDAAEMGR